ncbi:hypothetical protein ACBJ59_53750 [Nonomuraea sp. MTCD27]
MKRSPLLSGRRGVMAEQVIEATMQVIETVAVILRHLWEQEPTPTGI